MNRWLVCCLILMIAGQQPAIASLAFTPRFESITPREGLSQSNVNAILQDPRGFMWFGTQDGLNRFDGYSIRVYGHEPGNALSIGDDYVTALVIDSKGQLWVGSRGGLHRFDAATEQFANYRILDPNDPDPRDESVTALAESPDGAIWVGTQRGRVARLFPDRDRIDWFTPPDERGSAISALFKDLDQTLWIGTDSGLFRLTRDEEIVPVTVDGEVQPVHVITRDQDRRLWVALGRGIGWFATGDSRFRWLQRDLGSRVTAIMDDRMRDLWIGTESSGLYRYHASLEPAGHYQANSNAPNSILSNEILSLYEDDNGLVWIGTRVGGVSKFDHDDERFGHLYGTASENGVYAVLETRQGELALGTRGGLVTINPHDGSTRILSNDPDRNDSLSHDWVLAAIQSQDGAIWLGTFGGGLNRLDTNSGEVQRFEPDIGNPDSLERGLVARILEHTDGTLWLATNAGLERFDPAQGKVIDRYRNNPGDPRSISDDQVRALLLDGGGRLWVGTRSSGIDVIDLQTDEIRHLQHDPDDPDSLQSNFILSIVADRSNRIWVGTNQGLSRVDPESGKTLERFAESDGLPNEVVYGIVEDDDRRLWLSTNQGLARLDPETREFSTFDAHDGLQGNEFNIGAYGRTRDGRLMFGGVNGVNLFRPPGPPAILGTARPVVTDILLFNESMGHRGQNPNSPLPIHPSLIEQLELTHQDSVITFEFSVLHFADPDHNRFSYRLLGLDDRWIYTDPSKRLATFTGLDPGRYTFQLRAAHEDGVWTPDSVEIQVTVLPPPWRSLPAYAAYGLALVLLMLVVLRVRRAQEQLRERAQRAVADSEERLRLALWASGDALWDWNLRSGIMRRFNIHQGLDDAQIESVRSVGEFEERVHPEDFDRVRSALQAHIEDDTPYFEVTYRRRADNRWVWIMDRGQVVHRDRHGNATRMAGTMKDVTALKETEAALRRLNDELENRVDDRTKELKRANDELRETLRVLQETQSQLVQSEKMASLGSLVAGVAHEINTPLGITVTAASHLQDATRRLMNARDETGTLSADALRTYETAAREGSRLILDNLKRAARLVSSFKQVAVDQSDEKRRPFNLKHYVDEILLSLNPRLRRTQHQITVSIPDHIMMTSYPGAIYQIISNMVMNSLGHGFKNIDAGQIEIRAEEDGDLVRMVYTDSGHGMAPEVVKNVFEPFFTTRRGEGGSGLGMHIVYNLVTQGLQGSIRCKSSPGNGVRFDIQIPKMPDLSRTGEMTALSGEIRPSAEPGSGETVGS